MAVRLDHQCLFQSLTVDCLARQGPPPFYCRLLVASALGRGLHRAACPLPSQCARGRSLGGSSVKVGFCRWWGFLGDRKTPPLRLTKILAGPVCRARWAPSIKIDEAKNFGLPRSWFSVSVPSNVHRRCATREASHRCADSRSALENKSA